MAIHHLILCTSRIWPASYKNHVQVPSPRALHRTKNIATNKFMITQNHRVVSTPSRHLDKYDYNYYKFNMEYNKRMEDIRRTIKTVEDPLECLALIDALNRLCIDHHFREEIKGILERQVRIQETYSRNVDLPSLYEASLSLRLLRQEGYYVPADIFYKFMGGNGRFHEMLKKDTVGLMELYEAAQLQLPEEEILVEAANFSSKHLSESLQYLDPHRASIVNNTIKYPYHRSVPKFTSKSFEKQFEGPFHWVNALKDFAKMEFHMEKLIHRDELSEILKWWKDINLLKELKLARNQPVKLYTWTMACLPDLSLSEYRIELTKCISFVYLIDDIFDLYGTIDQLKLFTEAVQRWELIDKDQLPNYMKICLKALFDFTNNTCSNIYRKYGYNPANDLRNTWATLCNAFLVEAKWFESKTKPKADEYLNTARVTSGIYIPVAHMFFQLGLGRTKANGISLDNFKDITSSGATILRLWDDCGSAKDENQDGHDGSYIVYYINEHEGTKLESAKQHVLDMISNEWKHVNKETLCPGESSAVLTKSILNCAKMVPLMYSYDENQHLPLLEKHIKSILFDDISLETHI